MKTLREINEACRALRLWSLEGARDRATYYGALCMIAALNWALADTDGELVDVMRSVDAGLREE